MEIIRQNTKNHISTWLLVVFSVGLLGILAFSEIFQNAVKRDKNMDTFADPIKADIIANVKTIRLKNRLGKYTITLTDSGQWQLVEPRKMPSPEKTIDSILDSLKQISVHTLHKKEPINLKSFSLDNPIAILDLFTKLDEHIEVKIGLVNPINNTSYMTISNQDIIYQTNALSSRLESMRLGDFIDSQIFGHKVSDIKEFEIYRGKNSESSNRLKRGISGWESKRYRSISNDSVEGAIDSILRIKSHMIVDSQEEDLKKLLENYLKNPLYRVVVKTIDGNETTYSVSPLVRSIPELKIEKRQYFLIQASDREYPHLISKDYLGLFSLRYKDLK